MEFLDKISMRIMMNNMNTSADPSECSEDLAISLSVRIRMCTAVPHQSEKAITLSKPNSHASIFMEYMNIHAGIELSIKLI